MKGQPIICIISLLICILACSVAISEGADKPSKVVFVLFDISDSTNGEEVRSSYVREFRVILDKIRPGDVIVADRINEESVSKSTVPVNKEFEKLSAWNSSPMKEKILLKKQSQEKEEIVKKVEDLVLKQDARVRSTDILSSLQVAERVFKSYTKDNKVLIMMSDMVEESKDYNFKKEKMSDKRISEIISREKKGSRTPDLQGVKVYAVRGAVREDREKYHNVQNFWMKYFREAGANLASENYGNTLINFPE